MKLSSEQLEAINSLIENRLVLAGPGTGKSETILGLVDDLILVKGIDPKRIFVLTFTRAATAELKKKLLNNIKDENRLPYIYTLHGFSLRQLMKNAKKVTTLPSNFVIADDYEERYVILEDLKGFLKSNIKEVKELFNLLSANWETLNADRENWEQTFNNPEFLGAWKEHREIYGYALRSELVYQFKNILEGGEKVSIDGPIDYLIIDEYQDLNRCDLRVIEHLHKLGAKLFVAGDDDQSIYGFRFAYPEGIRNFINEVKNSKFFPITDCYRCDKKILELANNVIRQDYRRISKVLNPNSKEDGHTYLLRFSNQYKEAEKISKIISDMLARKVTTEEEIIILLRSDHNKCFSNVLIKELQKEKIDVNVNTSFFDLFESSIGRYLVSILKLYDDKNNNLAYRVLLDQFKGIGETTTNSIYNLAAKKRKRFVEILEDIKNDTEKSITNFNKVKEILEEVDEILEELNTEKETFENQLNIIQNRFSKHSKEFVESLLDLISRQEIKSINQLIAFINDLFGPSEPLEQGVRGVRIMSMHQAKGLTAEIVFIVAAEEEYLPGKNDVDEERRLLYVSLTRAKHYLFITCCRDRIDQQKHTGYKKFVTSKRNLTRFLENLPTIKSQSGEEFSLEN